MSAHLSLQHVLDGMDCRADRPSATVEPLLRQKWPSLRQPCTNLPRVLNAAGDVENTRRSVPLACNLTSRRIPARPRARLSILRCVHRN